MSSDDNKPRARAGLLASDHSKRGKRFVIIVDPSSHQATLLEPWEHGVLVLCDGTRDAAMIAKMLEKGVDEEPVDLRGVQRCFKYFEREKLTEAQVGKKPQSLPPASPKTLAEIQLAYREWHKDPEKSGVISAWLPPPMIDPAARGLELRSGLDPTVALPDDETGEKPSVAIGSMLVLAGSESLLASPNPKPKRDEPETLIGPLGQPAGLPELSNTPEPIDVDPDIQALLASVDEDVREVESREAKALAKKQKKAARVVPPLGKAIAGEASIPMARDRPQPSTNVMMSMPSEPPALKHTLVGKPAEGPSLENPPVLLVPAKRTPSVQDEATARLTPALERRGSLEIGAIVQDISSGEGPTEHMISALGLDDLGKATAAVIDTRTKSRVRPLLNPEFVDERTMELPDPPPAIAELMLPARAREVFELLRRAGMRARGGSDADGENTDRTSTERPKRRRAGSSSRLFDEALQSLTRGQLDVALEHFKKLREKMPQSKRLIAFIEAIEAVKTGEDFGSHPEDTNTFRILEKFEGVLKDAVAYGRCPACFSMVAKNFNKCFACGFSA